ncbi:MAG: hypothetical protein IGR76_01570 [Synechococcales cyanobacterium T60_A2020_003]|nr:hypothetical protein [Synechococcales cyanobacterium T60_A2020_003]
MLAIAPCRKQVNTSILIPYKTEGQSMDDGRFANWKSLLLLNRRGLRRSLSPQEDLTTAHSAKEWENSLKRMAGLDFGAMYGVSNL